MSKQFPNKIILMSLVLVLLFIDIHIYQRNSNLESGPSTQDLALRTNIHRKRQQADECYHVYIDFGSNVGVQIRKMYEYKYFPKTTGVVVFDKYFGPGEERVNNLNVCSFGFEPNPIHATRLKALEKCDQSKGRRTFYQTSTAISDENRQNVSFYTRGSYRSQYWTSALDQNGKPDHEWKIKTLDISEFILKEVKNRIIRQEDNNRFLLEPSVVMKMDAEGEEFKIFPKLIATGAICEIDYLHVEIHHNDIQARKDHLKQIQKDYKAYLASHPECKRTILEYDTDESWGKDTKIPEGCETFFPKNCDEKRCD